MVVTRSGRNQRDPTSDLLQTIVNAYAHLQKFNSALAEAQRIIDSDPSILSNKVEMETFRTLIKSTEAKGRVNDVDMDAGVSILNDTFHDEDHSLPIHWVSKLGLTKIVEMFLSTSSEPLVLERTGRKQKLPLSFTADCTDTKHVLIKAHPSYKDLCEEVELCCDEPLCVEDTFKESIWFGQYDLAEMFMECLPDESRESMRVNHDELSDALFERENHDKGLLLLTQFDPTFAQRRSGIRSSIPLSYLYRDEEIESDFDSRSSVLLQFLSYSRFYGLFEPASLSTEESTIPPWKRSDTIWADMADSLFGCYYWMLRRDIIKLASEKKYPLINDAVGKLSLPGIVSILTHHNIDAELVDDEGRNLLTAAINRASQWDMEHWKEYFKLLIIYAFLLQCKLSDRDKRTLKEFYSHGSARGLFCTTNPGNVRVTSDGVMRKLSSFICGRRNKQGQCLLHILAEEGLCTQFATDFMDTYSDDLATLDGKTGLLPFMSASMSKSTSEGCSVSLAFELLRRKPHVIDMLQRSYSMDGRIFFYAQPSKRLKAV